MHRTAVLVIEQGAEASLACAALALRPGLTVIEAPNATAALERLKREHPQVALAIAGTAALTGSARKLVHALDAHGIPVVGVTLDLAPAARRRALAGGVREIHERPMRWRDYAGLIGELVARFVPPA